MSIYLVNPSDESFGVAVIAPRWMYVLAATTPREHGVPLLIDETLTPLNVEAVRAGDLVGISVHTGNAYRGYEIGRALRQRGAFVVFGGIHATLYPEEPITHGGAHSVVTGDGEYVWPQVIEAWSSGELRPLYNGGQIPGDRFARPRWDLLPPEAYMWGSVQTLRGCPKHCSFCSVWQTDGQKPRVRPPADVVDEVRELRRRGFRFILLADDNFYPVTHADLAAAARRSDKAALSKLEEIRRQRFELMTMLADLPDDTVFYTQITMEAAEDADYLKAMAAARIRGALIGVESVTPGGLKSIHKEFNASGDDLIRRLRRFREHGVYVLGSFIFGLSTDTAETLDATIEVAQKAEISFAQFVMLTPFPGTVDFHKWENSNDQAPPIGGVPLTRYWLLPSTSRPKVYMSHSNLTPEEIRSLTQRAWDRFYSLPRAWKRSAQLETLRARLAFLIISKLYRQMYANTGIATDSARHKHASWVASVLARPCRRWFMAKAAL